MKKGFTIIEICSIMLIIICVLLLFIPKGIETTKQAKFISKWIQKYSDIRYMFSVIKTQAYSTNEVTRSNFKDMVISHARMNERLNKPYVQYTKNKKTIEKNSVFYMKDFYLNSFNEIIGFNWINNNCKNGELCAIMTFDLNGLEPPNIFGQDIFGINIYENKITPFGEDIDLKIVKRECANTGFYCSYYYLIGGHIE